MMDIKERLGIAIDEHGVMLGMSKKNLKHAVTDRLEIPETVDAVRAARDALIETGTILEEDLGAGVYVAAVNAGASNANVALVVAMKDGHGIALAACAKEGLIKQSTAKKAIGRIKKSASRQAG